MCIPLSFARQRFGKTVTATTNTQATTILELVDFFVVLV
jgi:hypothetical protein